MNRFVPPLPSEHGAWVMTGAAVLTPLSVAIARSELDGTAAIGYLLLFALVVTTLLLYEAATRRGRENPDRRDRSLRRFLLAEAGAIVLLAGGLAWLAGPIWLLAVLVVPAVPLNVRLRQRGSPVPFGNELVGVLGISAIVPAGSVLLGIGSTAEILLLWALFAAFHVGSVIRVGVVLATDGGIVARRHVLAGIGYHAVVFVAVAIAWLAGATELLAGLTGDAVAGSIGDGSAAAAIDVVLGLGVAAPVVFAIGVVRSVQAASMRHESVEFKLLGRAEGILSTVFVLGAPWML